MPSRNYAIITETPTGNSSVIATGTTSDESVNGVGARNADPSTPRLKAKNGHSPLHEGEQGAGTEHVAASGVHRGGLPGGLDVSIRVEIDQHDQDGKTEGYGFSSKWIFSIPPTLQPSPMA